MHSLFTAARLHLEAIHPAAPWALMTAVTFLAVWSTRKRLPALWLLFDRITPDGALGKAAQALPSVLGGALVTVGMTGGSFAEAWKGALAGALAPVLHEVLKWAPVVPYAGAVKAVAAKAGVVLLVLGLVACGGPPIPATGPCSSADRAAIGVAYNARLAAACPADGKPLEACPAYESIHADYVAQRKEWVSCSEK